MSDLEKKVRSEKTLLAFNFFNTPEGDLVMKELERSFGSHFPAFVASPAGEFCPIRAAIRDGQRQVILHILAMTQKSHEQTTNTKTKVRKD